MGKFEELEKLQKLKESGVLTQEEFDTEKAKILNSSDNHSIETTTNNTTNNFIEIKGDFPFVESKIPIQLLDGEKVIAQYEATALTGAGSTAVNGFVTLTSRRILFNKKTTGKSFLGTGLLGVALAAGNKDVSILFSQIAKIEAKKVRMQAGGLEITTTDGYTNRYILRYTNERDMIVELVKKAINS